MNRREWMTAGVAGLGTAVIGPSAIGAILSPSDGEFSFHYDHVLGTALDVWLHGPRTSVERAERIVLDEIERLRKVFSLYNSESELSRLNRANGPVRVSADLAAVLKLYERWQTLSGGACNARVGALVGIWAHAEREGILPDHAALARVARSLTRPGWYLDQESNTVARSDDTPLDLNAVAKGYILQVAAAAVRSAAPEITAGLVNLGGDMTGWGNTSWPLGVQDPFRSEANARPLTRIKLRHAAVATSGGYQRFYTIGGQRYSHLIDPRTGLPADGIAAATVVAQNSATANALATTLCVLNPIEGLRLIARFSGVECLIVAEKGEEFRSPGFAFLEWRDDSKTKPDDDKLVGTPWPDNFQVTVNVELPKFENARYRRPYVAVWIEDEKAKAVRTLTVWGNKQKYLRDLNDWWKFAQDDSDLVTAVTRATRGPGKYAVVWDGKDDKGKALPQGTYVVRVEVHREHGKHLRQSGKIKCEADADKIALEKNDETNATLVEYKKKEKAKK